MKPRWNYLDHPILRWFYPELRLARTQFERMEASTRGRAASPALAARVMVPVVFFIVFMLAVPPIYLWARPYWLPMWTMSLLMVPTVPIFLFVLLLTVRESARRGIRVYLVDRGVAVCLECGYDLRGLDATAERCPECGGDVHEKTKQLLRAAQPVPPVQ